MVAGVETTPGAKIVELPSRLLILRGRATAECIDGFIRD